MAKEPTRKITVPEGSDLAKLLSEAAARPILLEKNGELYRLERMGQEAEDIFAKYDPKAALAGIKAAAGSWKDIDVEAFKQFIYRSRKEGTRPPKSP
jgi:hypothetical protein